MLIAIRSVELPNYTMWVNEVCIYICVCAQFSSILVLLSRIYIWARNPRNEMNSRISNSEFSQSLIRPTFLSLSLSFCLPWRPLLNSRAYELRTCSFTLVSFRPSLPLFSLVENYSLRRGVCQRIIWILLLERAMWNNKKNTRPFDVSSALSKCTL